MPITGEIVSALGGMFSAQQVVAANLGAVAKPPRLKRVSAPAAASDSSVLIFGAGLELDAIKDDVIVQLDAAIRGTNSAIHGLGIADRFNAELETVLGKPGETKTIASSLKSLSQAFLDLAADPGIGAKAVVAASGAVTDRFKALSSHISDLRARADKELAEGVAKADALLKKIAALNGRIAVANTTASLGHGLEQERGALLKGLSAFLDFGFFIRSDGSLAVLTKQGAPLLAGPLLTKGVGKPVIEPGMSQAKGDLAGITAAGVDITPHITAGSLFALLRVRDLALPNLQSQIDTLAQTMQARMNQVANRAIGDGGAMAGYVGSRIFSDAASQRLSLAGGDTALRLEDESGTLLANTGLCALMKRYQHANGLPSPNIAWPVGQIALAVGEWLGAKGGGGGIDEAGRFVLSVPEGTRLVLRDQRSVTLVSRTRGSAEQPLGLTGPLAFSDASGNLWTMGEPARPADSLAVIAAKLNRGQDIEAKLVPATGGVALAVTSRRGTDIMAEMDGTGATVAAGLDLLAALDGAQEDVAVSFTHSNSGPSFTSHPFQATDRPLGLGGVLAFAEAPGNEALLVLDPSWDGATLARKIAGLEGVPGLNAAVPASGNRFVLSVALPAPRRLALKGASGGYCTPPMTAFVATGGTLAVMRGKSVLGSLKIPAGADFAAIAQSINAAPAFAAASVTASVGEAGPLSWLEIAAADGGPLAFQGAAAGHAPGLLDLALNARDSLGLRPTPEQIVSGLANFLGLNDLFVAVPAGAFDTKAPTGVFTTTAVPGTAGGLALNPSVAGPSSPLLHTGTVRRAAELLTGPLNIAAAGGLPRSSQTLDEYAAALVAAASAARMSTREQLAYNKYLEDNLGAQKVGLPAIDFDDEVQNLNSIRQAYHDSARVISTMAKLFESLAA